MVLGTQRRHTDSQQTHEKMLNIINQQRNANQNHNELLPVRMAVIKKTTNNKGWQGCGENGTFALWRDCKSHGRRSLVGYSPQGCKESDTTEQLHYTINFFPA